jgi:hypothetical protein
LLLLLLLLLWLLTLLLLALLMLLLLLRLTPAPHEWPTQHRESGPGPWQDPNTGHHPVRHAGIVPVPHTERHPAQKIRWHSPASGKMPINYNLMHNDITLMYGKMKKAMK